VNARGFSARGIKESETMTRSIHDVISTLRERLLGINADRLAYLIFYGSYARDEADENSDIDLLVVLHGPVSPYAEIFRTEGAVASVSLEHDVVIMCVFCSKEDYDGGESPLLRSVRKEGVAA
jgi:predicted nucleotidyltransferase